MEIQTTPKITKIMLFIGVMSTWFAVAFLSEPFVGRSAAPTLGGWAAFTFFGFAFHAPRQAALISFGFGLPMLGMSYYRYIRQETLGLAVAITAVGIAGTIVAYRRSRLQKGSVPRSAARTSSGSRVIITSAALFYLMMSS